MVATDSGLTSQEVAAAVRACSQAQAAAVRRLANAKTDNERQEAMELLATASAAAANVGRAGSEMVPSGFVETRPQRWMPPHDAELEAAVAAALAEEEE